MYLSRAPDGRTHLTDGRTLPLSRDVYLRVISVYLLLMTDYTDTFSWDEMDGADWSELFMYRTPEEDLTEDDPEYADLIYRMF